MIKKSLQLLMAMAAVLTFSTAVAATAPSTNAAIDVAPQACGFMPPCDYRTVVPW